jgi:hypothetical protein
MDTFTGSVGPARGDRRIFVIAGSESEARTGLTVARGAARRQGASIVLLVPHIVPYGTELNACGHDLHAIGDRFRPIAEETGLDTTVHVCACREPEHMFARMLVDDAAVIVPGRRGRWRRSSTERLAARLAAQGHSARFADIDAGEPGGAAPACSHQATATVVSFREAAGGRRLVR